MFPPGFYTCLAGFVEPGECLEGTVKRKVFEESGVYVNDIRYHTSQLWPFSSTLSIDYMTTALSLGAKSFFLRSVTSPCEKVIFWI